MARLVALTAGGQRSTWQGLGLTCTDHSCLLADVDLVFDPTGDGLVGWTIECDRDDEVSVDGIATRLVTPVERTPVGESRLGRQRIVSLDHVVVNTDDGERTSAAFESVLGLGMRRVRDAGRGVTQRFHMLDNCVIEIVSGPHVTEQGAQLWGMVLSVADIDAIAAWLGPDVMSPPKNAVQPGRRIATVRAAAGLGVPFAVMTPHVSTAH